MTKAELKRLSIEARAIEGPLQLAYAVWCALDDSEELQDGTHIVDNDNFQALCKTLDALDGLPDDQPGYTMEAAAKARWALRSLIGTAEPPNA